MKGNYLLQTGEVVPLEDSDIEALGGLEGALNNGIVPASDEEVAAHAQKTAVPQQESTYGQIQKAFPTVLPKDVADATDKDAAVGVGFIKGILGGHQMAADVAAAAAAKFGLTGAKEALSVPLAERAVSLGVQGQRLERSVIHGAVDAATLATTPEQRQGNRALKNILFPERTSLEQASARMGVDPVSQPKEFAEKLDKEQPFYSAVGEIAGGVTAFEAMAAPAIASLKEIPAIAAIVKAGDAARKAGKVASASRIATSGTVTGAGLGGILGAAQAMDEVAKDVRDNPDITAENAASMYFHEAGWRVASGALVGGAFGAASDALGSVAKNTRAKQGVALVDAESAYQKRMESLLEKRKTAAELIAKEGMKEGYSPLSGNDKLSALKAGLDRIDRELYATKPLGPGELPPLNLSSIAKPVAIRAARGGIVGGAFGGPMGALKGAAAGLLWGESGEVLGQPATQARVLGLVSDVSAMGAALFGSRYSTSTLAKNYLAGSAEPLFRTNDSSLDELYNFYKSEADKDPTSTGLEASQTMLATSDPGVAAQLAMAAGRRIMALKMAHQHYVTYVDADPLSASASLGPSQEEKQAFVDYADGTDPNIFKSRVAQGIATPEMVAAMKDVNPATYDQMREEFIMALIDAAENGRIQDIDQGRVDAIKTVLGITDLNDEAQKIRDLQAQFAAAKEGDPMGGSSDKTAAAPSRYSGHAADTSKSGADKVEQGQ